DHVAGFDAGLRRRTVDLRLGNECAFRLLQAVAVGDLRWHRLDVDADPATADCTLVLELGDDTLDGRCGDRERDADAAAGRRINRRVDAEDVAFGIERRTTRIALVHGC